MRDFLKLEIWQRSHQLTLKIYRVTQNYPSEEKYGLTQQMRKASASIPTNIAEGCGRNSNSQLLHFLQIAAASASELEYHLILSRDLMYLPDQIFKELSTETIEIRKMIFAYSEKLLKADS